MHRMMGYPAPNVTVGALGVANHRMTGPPPPTGQPGAGLLGGVSLSQPPNSSSMGSNASNNNNLISPRSVASNMNNPPGGAGVPNQQDHGYNTTAGQQNMGRPMLDDRERKLPRPIGTERALTRRAPGPPQQQSSGMGPPVGFSPADLGLWGFGAPGVDLGGPGSQLPAMNPSAPPPGLTHSDWLNLAGLSAGAPAPNASVEDPGLPYLQKPGMPQQPAQQQQSQQQNQQQQQHHHHHHHHHHAMLRQLEGISEGANESLSDLQFTQTAASMNGAGPNANSANAFHPAGGFLNGLPPPTHGHGGMPVGSVPPMFPHGVMQHQPPNAGPGEQQQHNEGGASNVNGMWVGQGASMKGKVSGPSPNSIMTEQQLAESGMPWVKWSQQ